VINQEFHDDPIQKTNKLVIVKNDNKFNPVCSALSFWHFWVFVHNQGKVLRKAKYSKTKLLKKVELSVSEQNAW
jgi:hypothetical protein